MIVLQPSDYGDEFSYSREMSGSASVLPAEPENDTIARLHQAVKDVTGKAVEKPEKMRIGFV